MAQLLASEDVLVTKDNQIQAMQPYVKDFDALKKQQMQQQQEIEALKAQVAELMQSLLFMCVLWFYSDSTCFLSYSHSRFFYFFVWNSSVCCHLVHAQQVIYDRCFSVKLL